MRLVRYTYPTRSLAFAPRSFQRSPWTGLESEIDRLFATALDGVSATDRHGFPVDLYEDKDHTYVRAELPGVNRDEIGVELIDGYLNITAARKQGEGETAQAFSFSRSLSVPDEVQADQITAAYENGVLTVTLPKREEAKPKKITVAVK